MTRSHSKNQACMIRVLSQLILLCIVFALTACGNSSNATPPATSSFAPSEARSLLLETTALPELLETTVPPTTEPIPTEPIPTEPYVESTASIGVTGDVIGHMPVVNACKTQDGYDFTGIFTYVKPYFESFDFMVANLEVNLGGSEAGPYQGYPTFNSPDEWAIALKEAGVDMALTANNHTYDVGHNGFLRTQSVLTQAGLQHLGTRANEDEPVYIIQEINDIRVGMLCYTYETGSPSDPHKYLNGIRLSVVDSALVSSFNYNDLDSFYEDVAVSLDAIYAEGAEATIVFLHWGDEYALSPNKNQQAIAQQLCELGVDVIVGGHPHVIQPFQMLTSSTGHNTYCIYSVGNAISNQRVDTLSHLTSKSQYTEDGMIFHVVFEKWNDGTVNVAEINIIPTWVNKEIKNNKWDYSIIPLDVSVSSWDGYDVGNISKAYASYNRTLSIIGEGLNECREVLSLTTVPLTAE